MRSLWSILDQHLPRITGQVRRAAYALEDIGVATTPENIGLARELIRDGFPVTKRNLILYRSDYE